MSQEVAWDGVHALVDSAPTAVQSGIATADRTHVVQAADIVVERATAARLSELASDWRDLTRRADGANVFMHPALLGAAMAAYPRRRILVLLAWRQRPGVQPQLAGIWAFSSNRHPQSVLPLRILSAPPIPNTYLATPVVDGDCLDAVLEAFLAYVAADAALPRVVALDAMGADTETMAALARVLAARQGSLRVFGRSRRPRLASERDGKAYLEQAMSSSTRKKLRQHRRRLGEKGRLEQVLATGTAAVCAAFEEFLALEASGWKGRQGTALLSDPADAQFARAMIAALAAQGHAHIHSLVLDGKPVSMQVVLQAGSTAFTWKTAYDEALHDFSPGTLLFEDYTARLLADRTVESVDSCSFDDTGYMAAWQERVELVQLWFDARPGGSATFALAAALQSLYLGGRARAKRLYHRYLRPSRR